MLNSTIWVIGAEGRLGSKVVSRLKRRKKETIIVTDKDVDITDLAALTKAATIYKPGIIINCGRISDLDYCEEHEIEAYKVNTLGARNVAIVSRQQNAKLIHFSTDDVFSGINDRPKNEFDVPTPNLVYGLSNLAGENFVKELNPKHLIIRCSWLYGIGKDYFQYVVEKGKAGEAFDAPLDKISTPTSITQLLNCLEALLDTDEYGIIHISDEGMCSRAEFAKSVLRYMGYDPYLVNGTISTNGSRTSTVLENLMLKMTGIYEMPDWRDDMEAFTTKMKGANL